LKAGLIPGFFFILASNPNIMKRKLLLTASLSLFMGTFMLAQTCCPWINSAVLIPANPTTQDTIKLATNVSTPSQGSILSSGATIQGTTVFATACYFSGMLPAIGTYIDTIVIGVLPVGSYMLNFNAFMSTSNTNCVPVDSNSSRIPFSVSAAGPPRPCCIIADSAHTLPAILNPAPDTSGFIVSKVTLPAMGHLIDHQIHVDQVRKALTLEVCYFSDNNANSNQVTDTFSLGIPLQPGVYSAKLIAIQSSNNLACNLIASDTLNWAFEVDSGGTAALVPFENLTTLKIFPNPAADHFIIDWPNNRSTTVSCFDSAGKLKQQIVLERGSNKVTCNDWPNGIYFFYGSGILGKLSIDK
jgi:hypothetical protein